MFIMIRNNYWTLLQLLFRNLYRGNSQDMEIVEILDPPPRNPFDIWGENICLATSRQPGADMLKGADRDTCCDVMKCDVPRHWNWDARPVNKLC